MARLAARPTGPVREPLADLTGTVVHAFTTVQLDTLVATFSAAAYVLRVRGVPIAALVRALTLAEQACLTTKGKKPS